MPLIVLIQNGWPTAFKLNVYCTPLTNVNVEFEPLIAPLKTYSPLPLFVTLNIVFNDDVATSLNDDDTIKLPLNAENVLTSNPLSGEIDAVTEPDDINVLNNASGDNAERGILFNPAPLPEKNEPVATLMFPPLTNNEPVN